MPWIPLSQFQCKPEPIVPEKEEAHIVLWKLISEQQKDINVTKVKVKWIKKNIIGEAFDFYKTIVDEKKNEYHHVGIYSFRYESLKKFTSMLPSKNEIYHKLEQWRALDNKMTIGTSYVKDVPISVDTKEDLIKVENIIK